MCPEPVLANQTMNRFNEDCGKERGVSFRTDTRSWRGSEALQKGSCVKFPGLDAFMHGLKRYPQPAVRGNILSVQSSGSAPESVLAKESKIRAFLLISI